MSAEHGASRSGQQPAGSAAVQLALAHRAVLPTPCLSPCAAAVNVKSCAASPAAHGTQPMAVPESAPAAVTARTAGGEHTAITMNRMVIIG
eukprot:COSAG05_NODE_74_length_21769_cov_194.316290_19_plen_91_part_00